MLYRYNVFKVYYYQYTSYKYNQEYKARWKEDVIQ
jgi:hypothetical protein